MSLRPVPSGISFDPTMRDVFLTELQPYLILPVSQVPHHQTSTALGASGLARARLVREPELDYDLSASTTHRTDTDVTTYLVVNGLSIVRRMSDKLTSSARVARQDLDDGLGHQGQWQWSAGLTHRPLPTASWSLTYAGTAQDRPQETTNTLTGLGRADWYPGVSTIASASGSVRARGSALAGTLGWSETTSVTPHPMVTLTAGALYSRTMSRDPAVGLTVTESLRLDTGVTLTPAPAVSASGTLSRLVLGVRPTTLATLQLNFSPLRGEVQFSVAYSSSLDTAADATTEYFTPSLRWNLRGDTSLTASYTYFKNTSPVQTAYSRIAALNLIVNL